MQGQGDYQTPSPADSAVHDLGNEDLKKPRESQTTDSCSPHTLPLTSAGGDNSLLRKLDKKVGKKDVQKLKSFYETQLKNFQQNALKVEANLVNQIYQVCQENQENV